MHPIYSQYDQLSHDQDQARVECLPYPILIKYENLGMQEYHVDNMIFNVPSIKDLGRPKESPLVISSIISIGHSPNQSLFIYASIDYPFDVPFNHRLKEKCYAKIAYLSYINFMHRYFNKCKWQDYGLSKYKQE